MYMDNISICIGLTFPTSGEWILIKSMIHAIPVHVATNEKLNWNGQYYKQSI